MTLEGQIQYFVVPESEITDTMMSAMKDDFNTDFTVLRRSDPSLNPLKFVVECILMFKWGKAPASLFNAGYGPYSNDELQSDVLTEPEWDTESEV